MRTPDMITGEIRAYLNGVGGQIPTYAYETLSGLCDDLSEALTEYHRKTPSTEILEAQSPSSSVEIAGRQKGASATVKVYADDPVAARDAAVRIYRETVKMLETNDDE